MGAKWSQPTYDRDFFCSEAFQPSQTNHIISSRSSHLLSVASSTIDLGILRQIDQQIQELKHKKDLNRLNTANAELEKYKETKQRYLIAAGTNYELGITTANFSETAARSLVKSMMWRLIAGSVTFLTSLRFSTSISTALSIVGSDFFSKAATCCDYVYRRTAHE